MTDAERALLEFVLTNCGYGRGQRALDDLQPFRKAVAAERLTPEKKREIGEAYRATVAANVALGEATAGISLADHPDFDKWGLDDA